MFTYIIILIVGALANRLRGGGVVFEDKDFFGTQKRRIVYCLLAAMVYACSALGADWAQVSYVFIILFLMHLTGWGRPIGALGGWENKPLKEFTLLDWLTNLTLKALGKMPVQVKDGRVFDHRPNKHLKLWGFVWLTYWGLITGSMLGLFIGSIAPVISFGVIGIMYYLSFLYCKITNKEVGLGWPAAEYVFGAVSFIGLL